MNNLNPFRKLAPRPRAGSFLIFLLLALFLLAGLPALVTPLRADNLPVYMGQWGSSGTGNGQFGPQGGQIAVDSSNNVYVADTDNSRIEKFDYNGNYLTQWGNQGSGDGQLWNPEGIVVDSSNNVYVADYANDRIEKFDSNGNYLTQWGSQGSGNGQFNDPYGIAVDSSNDVYVSDLSNSRIEKFTSSGNYLTQWGSYGSGNGQFDGYPEGVAVDSSNNVYVTDTTDCRIEKFDRNGTYLSQWGSSGSGNGQFEVPNGIAIDSSNNVYVTDGENSRIEKFNNNGNYLNQWGGPGYGGDGRFLEPQGIATGGNGNIIYVSDYFNQFIQVFVNNTNISPIIAIPPNITSQPTNQDIVVGNTVSFSVTAAGVAPLTYQWTSNNVALANATNGTLTLTNIGLAAGASYAVLVTNNFGGTLSSNALLTVIPALVTTLPATGISATNAVMNGSVTLGPDETVAWFEWGTDTNYGNITGDTIVPGDNGSNSISTLLSGLPGNVYHYRLDAANDYGVVYGNDQAFTVGFAPGATTLPPVNSENGYTLNASVNPNGWDTTAYFKWGTGLLTNFTSVIDLGAGATALNVSSLITGLTPFSQYDYEVVASNYLGATIGRELTFLAPPFAGVPSGQWQTVASSADGTKLIAGESFGPANDIFISTNSGASWSLANTVPAEGVASSADGAKLVAGNYTGSIYLSTNSGSSWTLATNAPGVDWNAFASSADGTKLAAVAINTTGVYTSTNSGFNWTRQTNGLQLPFTEFTSVASSADGSKLVAAVGASGAHGPIFTSTNFGVNWKKATNAPLAAWYSVASSADGNTLLACAYDLGNVYLSTNAGVIWTKTSLPVKNWNSVAESAEGTKMVALANSSSASYGIGTGGIYISKDSGTTWATNNVPSAAWTCTAMSADGNEFLATIGGPSTAGGIYVSQTTPSPVLSLSAADSVISWLIPSLDFTLQESPDLINWTDVTNAPVLNLTNLQNQIVLPSPDGNNFFRLLH
jgi:hypothetical protein